MERLTDEQRDMAGAAYKFAVRRLEPFIEAYPLLSSDLRSAAGLGVMEAARKFADSGWKGTFEEFAALVASRRAKDKLDDASPHRRKRTQRGRKAVALLDDLDRSGYLAGSISTSDDRAVAALEARDELEPILALARLTAEERMALGLDGGDRRYDKVGMRAWQRIKAASEGRAMSRAVGRCEKIDDGVFLKIVTENPIATAAEIASAYSAETGRPMSQGTAKKLRRQVAGPRPSGWNTHVAKLRRMGVA